MIELVSADITRIKADIVVLSANPRLIRGGGVSGAIHKAAGPELELAAKALGPIEPGNAVMTDAFNLQAKKVIHAVAPVFEEQKPNLDEVFLRTYQSVFACNLETAPTQTIVFPAIGSGIYRWPPEIAANLAVTAFLSSPYLATLVAVIDELNYRAYASALNLKQIG